MCDFLLTNRDMTENTENGLDTIRMITTDSPRLTVTPGECYASDVITQIRRDLRHTHDNSAAVNCNAVELNDLIFRRLNLPPECDGTYVSPKLDSAAADSGAVGLDDLTFRRLSFPPEEFAAGWDAAAAACGAVKQNDLIFRRTSFPPGGTVTIYGATCGLGPSMQSTSDWATRFRIVSFLFLIRQFSELRHSSD